MRISIVSMDTRGGIQPYAALGLGLQAAGHEVTVVAPANFADWFAELGLPMKPSTGNVQEVMQASAGLAEGGGMSAMRVMKSQMEAQIPVWTAETLEACAGAQLVTGGVGGSVIGVHVAEKLAVPFVTTHLQPIGVRTTEYPGVLGMAVPSWMGPGGRYVSHSVSDLAVRMPFASAGAIARAELGLRGKSTATLGQPTLFGFSPRVAPVPSRSGHETLVTGYWNLPPARWTPPADLEQFLDAAARDGVPVVSIGFGSMSSADPEALSTLVLDAVRQAGVRAVLLSGWGGLEEASIADDVFVTEGVPHEWLFPRVAAVVHHGGAGTTGAALQAGAPAIVVPFGVDQPFWGSRVAALGVGPKPIARAALTGDRLAAALRETVAAAAMRARADALGRSIRLEDGVAVAVERFGRLAAALN